jgi:hypothetical protein
MIILYTARYTFGTSICSKNGEPFYPRDIASLSKTKYKCMEMSFSKTKNHNIACSWANLNNDFTWYSA